MDFERNFELEQLIKEKKRDDLYFKFDLLKIKLELKEIYKNHKYSLSIEEVTEKIKGGFFLNTNWVKFKDDYIFTDPKFNREWWSNQKLIEYPENEIDNKEYSKLSDTQKDISIRAESAQFIFAFGNDREGVFFQKNFEYFLFDKNLKYFLMKAEQWNIIEEEYKDDFKDEELRSFHDKYRSLLISQYKEWEKNTLKIFDDEEKSLNETKSNVLSELDKDGNGEVDVIEGNDFNKLLKKHQKRILEIDRNYVQQFIKVSSYLKTKKGNIQSIFNSIKDIPTQEVLNEYVEIVKDEIHTYNLVLFNSLNMIVSLVEDDMITFYEIHEMFDNLNMFDSKHEKDVSQKLNNIGDGLKDLMHEIRDVGNKISNSIQELIDVNEESNKQLTNHLSEIDSSIKLGNLINAINTYQNYKTNRKLNS